VLFELSDIRCVSITDGYGRQYVSDDAEHVHLSVEDEGQTLRIIHSGDTRHSYPKEEQ